MSILRKHFQSGDSAETVDREPFSSRVLPYFLENLHWSRRSVVLDIGPVCGNNIGYFAQQFHRLYVFDVLARLQACLQNETPPETLWKEFSYDRNLFDGMMMWHIADHLPDESLVPMAEICRDLVKPDGLLAVYSCDKPLFTGVCGFRMLDANRLQPYCASHLGLPLHARSSRELIRILDGFQMQRSFIYRNGVREFIFRRS